jgi:hypothetical protein
LHQLGLDNCVANDDDGVLALAEYWCHKDQDQERERLRDILRNEFLSQKGPFFDQSRIPQEIVRGFRMIAKNSLEESPDGLRVSNKPVDARLERFSPLPSRVSCNPGCRPLIPCEPSSQLTLIMKEIEAYEVFDAVQLPMVHGILCLALQNNILPEKVLGKGGFNLVIECSTKSLVKGALSLEYHHVYLTGGDWNLHNSELARGAYAEAELNKRIGRSSTVRAVGNPVLKGDFSCAFGHTKPVGEKGEVVVFRFRALLRNQLRDIYKQEFDQQFHRTGEMSDKVRCVQQAVHVAVGQMNDKGKMSHLDLSPSNLYIEDSSEENQTVVWVPDLGCAAVHALPTQISCHPEPLMRRHSTCADPEKHQSKEEPEEENESWPKDGQCRIIQPKGCRL